MRLESATASQVTSKKEAKMEDKGNNRAQDIRIENFDVAYGNRWVGVLLNFLCFYSLIFTLFLFFKVLCMDMQISKYSSSVFV